MRLSFVLAVLITTCALAQTPSPAPAQPDAAAAQATPATPPPAAPAALSTPAITGPLSNLPPAMFDAGPFGNIAVNGILDGLGM